MKRKGLLVLAVSSLCGILTASLGAQSVPTSILRGSIPFEFGVGGKTMPAGDYEVRSLSRGLVWLYRCGGGNEEALVRMYDLGYSASGEKATLKFNRYGNRYFLARVSSGDGELIQGLSTSRAEREVGKTASSRPAQTATLVARRSGR